MKPHIWLVLLAITTATGPAQNHRGMEPGKWESVIQTTIEGAKTQPPPFARVKCLTAEEVRKHSEALKAQHAPADCTLFDRTADEAPDKVHIKFSYRCAAGGEGTTEMTLTKDFSESVTHGVTHGRKFVTRATMKRIGDCD